MAINPDLITTIRVDQLPDEALTLDSLFPHTVGTELKSSTIQELVDLVATTIDAGSGVGFLAESRVSGQTLPDIPTDPSFMLVGVGTFINVNGYADVITTENLNALITATDHWVLGVEIPIEAEVGVQTVTGSAVDNTDPLNPVVNLSSATPDLQAVTDEGEETTNDVIFRLDADKYIKVNTADQSFEVWDLSVDADEPMSYVKGNTIVIGNTSTDYITTLDNDGGGISIFDNSNSDETIFRKSGVTKNGTTYPFPTGSATSFATIAIAKTASFTAENDQPYTANGTITVTDPTGVTNKGFIVHVIGGTSTIGGVGYTTGALVYRFYNGSTWASVDMNGSGGVSDGDKGDITVSSSGTVWTIDNGVVNNAKVASGIDAVKLADGSVSNTEFELLNGVTGTIANQAYADAKVADAINDGTTTIAPSQNAVFDALALKLDKSIPANTIKANNTGSTADVTDFTFKQAGSQSYGGTLTWTGTAPTGLTSTYTWSQIGNQVSFRLDVVATSAGTGVTALVATLPSDMPSPLIQTGKTGANAILYMLAGVMQTSITAQTTAARVSYIRRNAADNGFEIAHVQGSTNVGMVSITGNYFTN